MVTFLRAYFAGCLISLLLASNCYGDIAVIVSHDSPLNSATPQEISALFLAKTNRLTGIYLKPIDMLNGDELRDIFYRVVTKKSPMQMKAYWSRLIFTGKGIPPTNVESAEDVIDIVAEEPSHIGYVNANEIIDRVKVLLTVSILVAD
ncbi:MAG: phosphate ABC transporter substrate-binding protein [Pseudomonadales bacterium]|nr:phosphate ABC transporter substrate-binding protein [Pseudomonadales bacterium]